MRILIAGAQGFIGAQIAGVLAQAGHEVVAAVRKKSSSLPYACIECDFNRDISTEIWLPRLKNIDVVINCVGALQEERTVSLQAVHELAPQALFTACQMAGVKRIMHFSALGANNETPTHFAATKKSAENFIQTLTNIDWVILRPSLVYASGSYGGTSLMRGLAGLPFIIPLPGKITGQFQPIYLPDLAQAVLVLVEKGQPVRETFDAVGPEIVAYSAILQKLRQWLRFGTAKLLPLPLWLVNSIVKVNRWFGAGPLSTTALKMLQYGNTTTQEKMQKFYQTIGFVPRAFSDVLRYTPGYVQDRWHARLYFLRPLLRTTLALLWLGSAIASLVTPHGESYRLLMQVGIAEKLAPLFLYGAAFLDGLLGFLMLINWRIHQTALAQIILIMIYTIICTFTLPQLWLEPFAPLLKNIPLIIATFILMVITEER